MIRQAVVLAGGRATRMRPLTEQIPKILLDVAGRPFVDWLFERLRASRFDEVVLSIGWLGHLVRAHVGDGRAHGLRVVYADEEDRALGTAGALRLALPLLRDAFLVTYGDSYLPFDYAAPLELLHASTDSDGVMSVYPNAGRWDASNVRTDGAWVLAYEKGTIDRAFDHIDCGALALRRSVVAALPEGHVGGLDVVQRDLAARKGLRALVARERFFEIGSPEGLATLTQHLKIP